MRHNPADPGWLNRDRFVLSAGHASMLLYASLYLTGYPLTLEDIKNFRQVGSPTAGHPERKYSPGIEATTGPLGQGISMSVGLALAERMLAVRFNRPGQEVIDHYTFTIASDGDMQEGIASEASSLAGHLGLGRLIAYYDDNRIQLASPTSETMSENVGERYDAYGWHVINLGEDLSLERIEQATREAMDEYDRPSLIIVRSHIGYGSPHKQDTSDAHGSPLGEEEVRLTKQAYGWDPDAHFYVPEEALAHFRRTVERGRYEGRNIRFGVREHGMAAIVNGLGLHGFRAFGGTFLTFSDYQRGAVRISALMKLPVIWVYTHDSIGLGEDGPTHQPIEHLAALRAMPRLNVVRPADANETALAWRFALRSEEAPTALALSRQGLPVLDPDTVPDDAIERGAYVLSDSEGKQPELILIGTGSEVSLCVEAAEPLRADGAAVRVVSMPCMATFMAADAAS